MNSEKTIRVKVCYRVTLTSAEYKALVALGREWGLGYDNAKPLKIVKRALQNSGDSGCLSLIPTKSKL